jgi:hypothetical protein
MAAVQTTQLQPKARQWVERHPDAPIYIISGVAVGSVLVLGGALANTACLTALVTTGGCLVLLQKLPTRIADIPGVALIIPAAWGDFDLKRWLIKNQLLVDIGVSLAVFVAFGSSVTGILAAGLSGLLCSCALKILERIS